MIANGHPKPEVQVTRIVLILCMLSFVLVQIASAAPGDEVYAKPGRLVPTRGTRLNLYCIGSGSPSVVFESGWEDWSPVWAFVQPRVAQWMRACSYDRAGTGFSDAATMPRSSVRIADELHEALHHDQNDCMGLRLANFSAVRASEHQRSIDTARISYSKPYEKI
jgi:hypothetical protein